MTAPRDTAYFAVLDPDDLTRATYWRRSRGRLEPWPPKASVGPVLYAADLPPGLDNRERRAWINTWFTEVRYPWLDRVHASVEADLDLARARFATLSLRCCLCGRKLVDPASVLDAVGPDCRQYLTADVREQLQEAVRRVHGEHLATTVVTG